MDRTTVFSEDRLHRYTLWREWDGVPPFDKRFVQFIGLNPSTADEVRNDNTVTRCMGFASRWGYEAMCMTNIFAFRATDPKVMKAAKDPVGVANNFWLLNIAAEASLIVACWGTHGTFLNRGAEVRKIIPVALHAFRITKDGHPNHPLYLPNDTQPILWGRT